MSEELGKELLVESAKAVVIEGYNDTLRPALKVVGNIVALPFQAIDVALSKPKLWVEEKRYNFERTRELIAEKMKNVPVEEIVPPDNYVAVPALQYISYCMDNDELRDMYANLLASSMNKVVKNDVHPGFVEIIKQLSPDEAKILKCFYTNDNNHTIATIAFRAHKKEGGYATLVKRFTNVAELCNCENTDDYEKYIDNLLRLGLLREIGDAFLTDSSLYEKLENHSYIVNLKRQIESNEEINSQVERIELAKGIIELTSFGKSFCSICLETKNIEDIRVEVGDH